MEIFYLKWPIWELLPLEDAQSPLGPLPGFEPVRLGIFRPPERTWLHCTSAPIPLNLFSTRRIFIFIIIIWQYCAPSETHIGINIVKSLAMNLLTLIDPSSLMSMFNHTQNLW